MRKFRRCAAAHVHERLCREPGPHPCLTGEALLTDGGTVSHTQAMEQAKAEYRKYQVQNLSPVEEEYLQTIRSIEKAAKEGEKR